MLSISVDYRTCLERACRDCAAGKICDTGAIVRLEEDEPAAIDHSRCSGCGDCVSKCPAGALTLYDS